MLRWGAVVAFVVAAGIVLVRHVSVPAGEVVRGDRRAGGRAHGAADHESDAAHLLMCLVMPAMLVFPGAAPDAIRGVLTAMVVVYAGLLVPRVARWRTLSPASPDFRTPAVGYHLIAAAAMLWVMSGHRHDGGSMSTAPPVPVAILAALFVLDAVLLAHPRTRHLLRHGIPHLPGSPGALGIVPHVVMDLGTAYMLIAAVAG